MYRVWVPKIRANAPGTIFITDPPIIIMDVSGMPGQGPRTGAPKHALNHSLPMTGVDRIVPGRLIVETDFGTAKVWTSDDKDRSFIALLRWQHELLNTTHQKRHLKANQ